MWSDYLDNSKFLNILYDEIPSLSNVRISNLYIQDLGNRVKMVIDLPKHADNPPEKWKNSNKTAIEIDFFCIHSLMIDTNSNTYQGDIEINQLNGLLEINIKGNIILKMIAETGYIQSLSGYYENSSITI